MSNVYEIVTEQVVKALESGNVPWRKPWHAATDGPRNIVGRPYRGVNVLLLLATGHGSPYWLTFKQASERGGRIRKGEHGSIVVFWKTSQVREKDADGNTVVKTIPILRYYRVWNLEQVEGINPPITEDTVPRPFDPIAEAESVIAGYPNPPTITHAGGQAFYRASNDSITLPPKESFDSAHEYYSTAFHELTHSTGHAKRCARKNWLSSPFGSHDYGREELVAEMGAAFLCGETGILPKTLENSAAYLRSWIRTIKADSRAVVVAAGAAQKAADHILGRATTEVHEDSESRELVAA